MYCCGADLLEHPPRGGTRTRFGFWTPRLSPLPLSPAPQQILPLPLFLLNVVTNRNGRRRRSLVRARLQRGRRHCRGLVHRLRLRSAGLRALQQRRRVRAISCVTGAAGVPRARAPLRGQRRRWPRYRRARPSLLADRPGPRAPDGLWQRSLRRSPHACLATPHRPIRRGGRSAGGGDVGREAGRPRTVLAMTDAPPFGRLPP